MTRRQFLSVLALAWFQDWSEESAVTLEIRSRLESLIGGMSISLDFRAFDAGLNEAFRIQINADRLMPVASCFKAFVVPYYLSNTPRDEWDTGENSVLYSMIVHSNNQATGVVLDNVARRVRGRANAIVKFNEYLRYIGIQNGLHSWNWEGSPTIGLTDPRYAPSTVTGRLVRLRGQSFQVDNAFTAADLARGHDYFTRGEYFTPHDDLREIFHLTKELLSIPSTTTGYESPIERVYAPGYTGKDGILPADDIATGRVVADAGVIQIGDMRYIIAFMSAGESESVVLSVLSQVVDQVYLYQMSVGGIRIGELIDATG
jgi:hypothetical protein